MSSISPKALVEAYIALGSAYGLILEPMRLQSKTTVSIKNRRYHNLLADKLFPNVNQVWVSDITYFHMAGEVLN